MTVYGFKDKSVAQTLKHVAEERRLNPQRRTGIVPPPGQRFKNVRHLVVNPDENIPGAEVSSSEVIAGSGECTVYKSVNQSWGYSTFRPAEYPEGSGDPIKVTCFNLCQDEVKAESSGDYQGIRLYTAVQDVWGDIFITGVCDPKCQTPIPPTPGDPCEDYGGKYNGAVVGVEVVLESPIIYVEQWYLTVKDGLICSKDFFDSNVIDLCDYPSSPQHGGQGWCCDAAPEEITTAPIYAGNQYQIYLLWDTTEQDLK